MGHYFTNDDNLKSELRSITYKILDTSFVFYTDLGVFSKTSVDFGTNLLLKTYLKHNSEKKKILDVGCGYGVIGIVINKLTSSLVDGIDINKRCVHLTNMNIKSLDAKGNTAFISDVYENVKDSYDVIITNPPIRAGKSVYMKVLLEAKNYMKENAELWFVIRIKQGAKTIIKSLEDSYDIEVMDKQKGYFIIKAKNR